MLSEFDWNHKLVPYRLGGIAPLKQLSFSWLMKEVALK